MPPISLLVQVVARVERRVGRVAWEVAEDVAARPRGQQLFRQADRLLELMERLARTLVRALSRPWRRPAPPGDADAEADGDTVANDGRDLWGQAPMPLSAAVPLIIIVLPSYMAATLLVMAPYIPILVMRVIFGSTPVLQDCWPTPTNAEKCLRRWRRRLRGIRFSGLRKMRIMSIIAFDRLEQMLLRKEEKEMMGIKREEDDEEEEYEHDLEGGDSLLGTILLWWPITLLTTCGQILGLGGPWVPAFNSPVRNKMALESLEVPSKEEVAPKSDADVSPRKRKFLDGEAEALPTNQAIAYGLGAILHPTLKSHALKPDEIPTDSCSHFSRENESESESESDSDSGAVEDSVNVNKSEIQPKRLSPLAKLLSASPLPSDGEEDDPSYVPNPDEESGDEDDDEITDNEDDENGETCKELQIEESIGKESQKFIEEETKESQGMKSEKIDEIESKECSGKESKNSNEKETKGPAGKVFTEYENNDKTLTPRSAQLDL